MRCACPPINSFRFLNNTVCKPWGYAWTKSDKPALSWQFRFLCGERFTQTEIFINSIRKNIGALRNHHNSFEVSSICLNICSQLLQAILVKDILLAYSKHVAEQNNSNSLERHRGCTLTPGASINPLHNIRFQRAAVHSKEESTEKEKADIKSFFSRRYFDKVC